MNSDYQFPELENIDETNYSDFSPTLEYQFENNKNIIYGATLPIAWNEVKQNIQGPFTNFTSNELKELNNSKSFVDVLNSNEYDKITEISNASIFVEVNFEKSLPFSEPFLKMDAPLQFNNYNVHSFGFTGQNKNAKLNYFINETDFSISLLPENKEHEIILILKDTNFKNFIEYFNWYKSNKNNSEALFESDRVEIPIIEFNLKKSFNNIVGSTFDANSEEYSIDEMLQTNAFILNEKGSEVKSFSRIMVKSADDNETETKPRNFILNKPFVIFLKRKNSEFPYFAVFISNEKLLKNYDY